MLAKVNSIDTLISQALIDMDISHEEFIIFCMNTLKNGRVILIGEKQ